MSGWCWSWKRCELILILLYAVAFYSVAISRSLQLSQDHFRSLYGLRPGWIFNRLNDLSDAQWRNFRGNLPILTVVLGIFTIIANTIRGRNQLKGRGMSIVWILISMIYLLYLHGACVAFVVSIAAMNFFLTKSFYQSKYYLFMLWISNIAILLLNRIYEGYSFSKFGQHWGVLDNYRGTFRWHICFNMVTLRMISFGCDYHWSKTGSHFDQKKHMQRCSICSSGKACYHLLQETSIQSEKYSFSMYLCYLIYAPLYIAGPIVSFNAFAAQLDVPQKNYSSGQVAWYGFRWFLNLLLMEAMTHFSYYNAFAKSGLWSQLSPFEIFIIGYGVLNFMWLKFFLIWRYFRFWSLISGIETPENMPRCINNCHDLESFWKSWHASFNKWLVRYMYIPLGGTRRKLLNVWVIFTFVAIWHDLEWKLLSWAWLTCIFLVPEIVVKSSINRYQAWIYEHFSTLQRAKLNRRYDENLPRMCRWKPTKEDAKRSHTLAALRHALEDMTTEEAKSALGRFVLRELSAVAGAITITCLMIANLVGYVIGPSGINWLVSRLLQKDGIPVICGIFTTFYVGTKLMFHIRDAKQSYKQSRSTPP